MSLSLTLACFWVLAAAGVAMLPMQRQYVPGVALLIVAPILITVIWVQHGAWFGAPALFGFVSMFRRPLRHFGRKALGLPTDPVPTKEDDA